MDVPNSASATDMSRNLGRISISHTRAPDLTFRRDSAKAIPVTTFTPSSGANPCVRSLNAGRIAIVEIGKEPINGCAYLTLESRQQPQIYNHLLEI